MREHAAEELAHYSVGTADIEYAFPFLPAGEYGELEGIAHRGDFDLRSHMEGKLDPSTRPRQVEKDEHGKPRHRGDELHAHPDERCNSEKEQHRQ